MGNVLDAVWDGWTESSPVAQDKPSNLIAGTAEFPFLSDVETIHHVRESKVMFIMRGLPGSGKSTLVQLLSAKYSDAVVCSADDFFRCEDGSYHFDASKLSVAHDMCQQKAKKAAMAGESVVIIDNTNVRRWEMDFYVRLAGECNYTTVVVSPRTPWCLDPNELALRNKHGVGVDILAKKVQMFEDIIPLYCAWFVNEAGSDKLLSLGRKWFRHCVNNVPDFSTYFQLVCNVSDLSEASLDDFYGRKDSITTTLHCTAYFAARGRVSGSHAYLKQAAVQKCMGRVSTLTVIGVVITPHTVGARVQLDGEQLTLWAKDDSEGGGKNTGGHSQTATGHTSKFCPTHGPGSRAHITLGYMSDSNAVQTGLDLVELIECEQASRDDVRFTDVDGGTIRYYGDGRCIVYLREPIKINTLFSARY